MRVYTIDFETYYNKDYTLSKLTTEEYIRDSRFKVLMVGIQADAARPVVLTHEQFKKILPSLDLESNAVLCHHAHFDGLILKHHYGAAPGLFLDTLSMARALYPSEKSHSLKAVAERLGLPPKGTELINVLGKEELTKEEFERLAAYCRNDIDITYRIWELLKKDIPLKELKLIDLTIRMFTEPVLRFNAELLKQEKKSEIERKEKLLAACCSGRAVLASNPQFAELLRSLGVEPPMKYSVAAAKKGEQRQTYAFGKSDEGFKALLSHDDEAVRAVCEARLGVKSTINETRADRFLSVSSRGAVPVYLTYYGAHTGRYSGGDKMNFQNMTRGSNLRLALEAPEGAALVVADLSQIEARVLAALAGETSLLQSFKNADQEEGETDVYTDMASRVFHKSVTKKDKHLRQVGKALVLGCGFGLGWLKFQEMQRIGMLGAPPNMFGEDMLGTLGVNLDFFITKFGDKAISCLPAGWDNRKLEHMIHCACSKAIVDLYRQSNPNIVALWETANRALAYCIDGAPFKFGVAPELEVSKEKILLPNGMFMRYTGLRKSGKEYIKTGKMHPEKVYGGLVVENVVQAIARIIMTDAMLQINKRYRIVLTVHDELVCCVPEEQAEECFSYMQICMTTPPIWAPDLPLNCSGGYARNYSK